MERPTTEVLVVGAGYAGMLFTMRLAGKAPSKSTHITLVNDSVTFTERLRLHQFATNHTIRWRSIPRMLAKTSVSFVEGHVSAIDTERRAVYVATRANNQDNRVIPYDYLVYALGSYTDRDSVPGVAEYAYTLAPYGPHSAASLREKLPALQERDARITVVGGGPTGIETAAEIASSYPRLRVQLVTEGQLGMFLSNGISRYIQRSLMRLGVEILDETAVTAVRADGIVTGERPTIPSDLTIWTGGFVAPPLAREAGLIVNERNQVLVDPFMRALSHPEIYAIGDAAYPQEEPGVAVRMSAATATILGAHGADCLSAVLLGAMPRPLSFAYLGQAIALGQGNAIGFNNYPDDKPRHPYFKGQLAFQTRELFVRYLADAPSIERRLPGSFYWPGKRRYAMARQRLASTESALAQSRPLDPALKQ
jgi:NADH dehydrogenase FAD-containing subunit